MVVLSLSILLLSVSLGVSLPASIKSSSKSGVTSGNVCEYGGMTYKPGEDFASTDGCNRCGCSHGGMTTCTLIACLQVTTADPVHPGCFYNGKWMKVGEYSPAVDGCNSCSCQAEVSGEKPSMFCTEMACLVG